MSKRRGILTGLGAVTGSLAVAGCLGTASNDTEPSQEQCDPEADDDGDEEMNWREPETLIKTVRTTSSSRINKIDFYENGAVEIHPNAGPTCYNAMVLKHASTTLSNIEDIPDDPSGIASEESEESEEDASAKLSVWYFNSDSVLTAHMAGAIQERCSFPNPTFEIQVVSTDGSCTNPNSVIEFEVPDSYLP